MDGDSELPLADIPLDTYEQRLPTENAFQRWLFFDANRWAIIGLLMAGTLATLLALVWTDVLQYRDSNAVQLLMSAFIAGNFTLVTIVITVNQLVLSREFGKPHTLQERNEGIQSFRRDVEDAVGRGVAPEGPRAFLRTIAGALNDRAVRLGEMTGEVSDGQAADEIERFASAVRDQTAALDDDLADTAFGEFDLLVALLFYRIAWQLHSTRRLREEYREVLPAAAVEALDEMQTLLRQLNISRQYLQTLYLQRELARLSRLLLYVGIPALLVSTVTMLAYPSNPGTVGNPALAQFAVALASAVAFLPIAILLSYVVRISTIVSRMAVLSPFISNG